MNDPLYNHAVFGPEKGRGGNIGKTDEQLIHDLVNNFTCLPSLCIDQTTFFSND